MSRLEILAPAGGFDSVTAAVRSGADAVYLGETSFSARANAQNFSAEELKKAVAYCHIHGVKVYVTLNTIVFDEEFKALREAIITAAEADADAHSAAELLIHLRDKHGIVSRSLADADEILHLPLRNNQRLTRDPIPDKTRDSGISFRKNMVIDSLLV